MRAAKDNFFHLGSLLLILGLAVAGVAVSSPARAQNAGADAWGKGGCSRCHGGLAEGGAGGENPAGPSLREARLDRASLVETIACGRPGTAMPFNRADAYTSHPCWGLPVGQVPPGTPQGARLTGADVDALADFLLAEVVGKTRITRQRCATFLGVQATSPQCTRYPAQ